MFDYILFIFIIVFFHFSSPVPSAVPDTSTWSASLMGRLNISELKLPNTKHWHSYPERATFLCLFIYLFVILLLIVFVTIAISYAFLLHNVFFSICIKHHSFIWLGISLFDSKHLYNYIILHNVLLLTRSISYFVFICGFMER